MANKKKQESITITVSKVVNQKLDEGAYNKSKLIDKLLNDYFNEKELQERLDEFMLKCVKENSERIEDKCSGK
jgi:hypothetical protein